MNDYWFAQVIPHEHAEEVAVIAEDRLARTLARSQKDHDTPRRGFWGRLLRPHVARYAP